MICRSSLIHSTIALSLWACASGGGAGSAASSTSYGYMVPGPTVARALGLGAADTIPELPALRTLPTTLLTAISQEVAQGHWDDKCARRFGGPTVYALIFHRVCDAARGPEADPVVIVGFAPDGRVLGRVAWTGPGTVTLLVPSRRF